MGTRNEGVLDLTMFEKLADIDVDVSSILDELIESHVVDNDANCAAYGEWVAGPARGHRVALTVSVGTGIGAGLVVEGAIWRGSSFAGEVGHMTMSETGLECPCGRSGCWETLVSGRRLPVGDDRTADLDFTDRYSRGRQST